MSDGLSRRRVATGLGLALGTTLIARGAQGALLTPSQVEGPFYPVQEQLDKDLDLVWVKGGERAATGEVVLVGGRVLDVDGAPLANALVDVWQANHHGRYAHPGDKNPAPLDPHFQGWGMIRTDANGRYNLKTIKPGAYPLSFIGGEGWRCRHIHFKVDHPAAEALTTQMYFEGDPLIEQDLEIRKAPAAQRPLLISSAMPDRETGLPRYQFDIVLDRSA